MENLVPLQNSNTWTFSLAHRPYSFECCFSIVQRPIVFVFFSFLSLLSFHFVLCAFGSQLLFSKRYFPLFTNRKTTQKWAKDRARNKLENQSIHLVCRRLFSVVPFSSSNTCLPLFAPYKHPSSRNSNFYVRISSVWRTNVSNRFCPFSIFLVFLCSHFVSTLLFCILSTDFDVQPIFSVYAFYIRIAFYLNIVHDVFRLFHTIENSWAARTTIDGCSSLAKNHWRKWMWKSSSRFTFLVLYLYFGLSGFSFVRDECSLSTTKNSLASGLLLVAFFDDVKKKQRYKYIMHKTRFGWSKCWSESENIRQRVEDRFDIDGWADVTTRREKWRRAQL